MVREKTAGPCLKCGIKLVDWDRVHQRDLSDSAFTFEIMRTEFIRHHFWHIEIDTKALEHAKKNGLAKILEHVPKRLKQSIGKAMPFRDGTQTPFSERAEYYAQHATATCCRKCVEEWHGIPQGQELTEEELAYLSSLAVLYLKERLAEIPMEPAKVVTKKKRAALPLLDAAQ
jgi:hypothetical protein